MPPIDDRHYSLVAELLAEGEVVPFLGAGANLCDRPDEAPWEPGEFLPSGGELAGRSPSAAGTRSPTRTCCGSRSTSTRSSARGSCTGTPRIFDADYPPTSLHRLLARLPALLRERGGPQLLVLTTNYDDLVERALDERRRAVRRRLVRGQARAAQGRFVHRAPEGEVVAIERPNKYTGLALAERPVILKLHGAIDRADPSATAT